MYPIVKDNLPHRCAVTLRTSDPEGFIKTSQVLSGFDPEIEISVTGARELGKLVGMIPREQVEQIEQRVIELAAEAAVLRSQVERLEAAHTILEEVAA